MGGERTGWHGEETLHLNMLRIEVSNGVAEENWPTLMIPEDGEALEGISK